MTSPAPRSRSSWRDVIVLAVVTVALVVAAVFAMFSTFMAYDDEGYVLLSLKNFIEHGGLYRDVYSQYGPFPFVFHWALHALGLPLTHTTGRLITIGAWTISAISCTVIVARATRYLAVRVAVLVGVFIYLWVMANEPTHPGGIIVALTTVLAALGCRWIEEEKPARWAIATGVIIGALLMTKINIGVFAAFSAGAWLLLHHRDARVRRWAPAIVGAGAILLPLGLMRPLIGTPWVRTFALVFSTSTIGCIAAAKAGPSGWAGWRALGQIIGGAVATCVGVALLVFLRGTTPHDLLEGILLGPLRHPGNFSMRFLWPESIGIIAVLSMLAAIGARVAPPRHAIAIDTGIVGLRLLLALALAFTVAGYPMINPSYAILEFALPFVWIFIRPLSGETALAAQSRAWLALLLVGQSLHAFPVPGSQIAWGTVLVVPLAGWGSWDAAQWLVQRDPNGWIGRRPTAVIASLAVTALAATVGWKFITVAARYRDGRYLAQPGAEAVRLPDDAASRYCVLTMNAVAHADVLFSLPGMFSFNVWTDLPTPTLANVTHWFSLLDEAHQREIIRTLEAHPRACVIVDEGHIEFLQQHALTPRGILREYIASSFEPAFWVGRFAFCVHRGRHIEPFLLADLLARAAQTTGDDPEGTLLTFTLLVPPPAAIASLELVSSTGGAIVRLQGGHTRATLAPVNGRGEIIGPAQPLSWPLTISRPGKLSLYFDRTALSAIGGGGTITLRDAAGNQIGLAWLRP